MRSTGSPRTVGIGVGLLTCCLLAIEVALTRLFSVTIWYHFAFLAISVALFGTGAAALTVHLLQRRLPQEHTGGILALGAALLGGVTVVVTQVLLACTPDLKSGSELGLFSGVTTDLLVTFVAAAAPFFVGGFAIALAMTRNPASLHSLYAWDLLGAGLGCLAVIPALELLGAPITLSATSLVAVAAGLAFSLSDPNSRRRTSRWILIAGCVCAAAIALGVALGWYEVRTAKGLHMDDLEMEFNEWNSFSMVTVLPRARFPGWGMSPTYEDPLPERKTLVIDMNAMTPLIRFDGDLRAVSHVMYDLSAFVYHARPGRSAGEVLVIGAGGGRDVLAALVAGAKRVSAVEINPLIVDRVMRGRYADYTGGLYNRGDVRAVIDDGRSFIRRQPDGKYDLIHLAMVDTSAATAAGAYALTENSLYTVQAFHDYFDHLKPDGLLSASSVSMPGLAAGAGLAAIAWQALVDRGVDPSRHVAAFGARWIERPGCMMHNVIVKCEPFSRREIAALQEAAQRLRFQVSHLPDDLPRPGQLITRLLSARDRRELEQVIESEPVDLAPATDDRPFFFYQNRLADIGEMLSTGKPAYMFGNGLFVLAKVAMIALVMVAIFLGVPFVLARKELRTRRGNTGTDLLYVTCLGLGFMFVEIGSLQKLTLYLGRPTLSLAVVLFTLLTSGALGSRLYGRLGGGPKRLAGAIAGLVGLIALLWIADLGDLILASTAHWPVSVRGLVAAGLLAPVGVFLGMPFPAGLTAVARRAPTRIPWLWSINSATSVLGSVAAVILALHLGVSAVLGIGAALYVGAALLALRVAKEIR